MTEAEESAVRQQFEHVFSMWHACRLPKAERGIPKGTLCDDCLGYIDAIMADLRGVADREGVLR
jgi:hypothetical protein